MLAYPITLEDDDGTVLVTSPDFPELTTFGDDREEAIARAVHALEEAIAARIHDRKDIPEPSQGETCAVLPTLTSVKVMLYQGMREQGIGKAELARRLGWHLPQVDRVLDVQHRSGLDQMEAALGAIGRRLHVTATAAPDPVAAAAGEDTGGRNRPLRTSPRNQD
jgi:antitoxin HicB